MRYSICDTLSWLGHGGLSLYADDGRSTVGALGLALSSVYCDGLRHGARSKALDSMRWSCSGRNQY
eukprot:scaffold1824_cov104-Skeletonema_dohrnii-CCMP3373.AAC.10